MSAHLVRASTPFFQAHLFFYYYYYLIACLSVFVPVCPPRVSVCPDGAHECVFYELSIKEKLMLYAFEGFKVKMSSHCC